MFVRNCWYVATWSHLLPAGAVLGRQILDEPVVLYRTDSGRLVALEDRCPHRLAPLSLGRVRGEALQCMYHGLTLDPAGRCTRVPGTDRIPPQAPAVAFQRQTASHQVGNAGAMVSREPGVEGERRRG